MRRMVLVVLVLVSCAVSVGAAPGPRAAKAKAATQQQGLGALLSGHVLPLSRKLKDLDGTWRRFSLGGGDQSITSAMYGLPGTVYYTTGQTVSAQGESYLVAYSPEVKMGSLQLMMTGRSEGTTEQVGGETPVRLALLNLRTMGSLVDIRPFSLQAEVASFSEALSSLRSISSQMSVGDEEESGDASLANLKNIALAAEMYMADYDTLPPMANAEEFRAALDEYVMNAEVFKDPESGAFYAVNASLSGKAVSALGDPSGTVLVYQAEPGKDGQRGVGFLDGRAKKVTEAEWEKLKAASGIE